MINSPQINDILIVEDRPLEREHLESLFTKRGYTTLSADSIKAAEVLLEAQKFRLAIIDLGLADGAGSPVFELVNNSASVDYIVILTGNPSSHLKQRFINSGAAAYIVKGSEQAGSQQLALQIEALLGGPLSKSEAAH